MIINYFFSLSDIITPGTSASVRTNAVGGDERDTFTRQVLPSSAMSRPMNQPSVVPYEVDRHCAGRPLLFEKPEFRMLVCIPITLDTSLLGKITNAPSSQFSRAVITFV